MTARAAEIRADIAALRKSVETMSARLDGIASGLERAGRIIDELLARDQRDSRSSTRASRS